MSGSSPDARSCDTIRKASLPSRLLEGLRQLPVLAGPGLPGQRPDDVLGHAAVPARVERGLLELGRQPAQVLPHQVDERLRGLGHEVEPGAARPLPQPADHGAPRRRPHLDLVRLGEDPEPGSPAVRARGHQEHGRALRGPAAGRSSRLGQRVAEPVGRLGRQIGHAPDEDETAAAEERERGAGSHEGVGRELVGVEDLAVPVAGLLVRQERPGHALEEVVDEERLRPVQQEERRDAPGRGFAEEGGDLQLRTLRRRS